MLLEHHPDVQIIDSLHFYIYTGISPVFYQAIEGGALDYYGEKADSVIFSEFQNGSWTEWQLSKQFTESFSGKVIATFLRDFPEGEKKIAYKIFSSEPLTVNNTYLFLPTPGEIPVKEKSMISFDSHIPKPRVISREEWGAAPPTDYYTNHPYFDKLTLHHAAGWSAETVEEGKIAVREIQDFHQNGRGWIDIGYHFLVDRAGNIYQGRPETVIGAHVGGANTGNIGVCILGCYHPPEANCNQTLTLTSRDSIVKLFAWVSQTYGQDPNVLLGHRDYFGTTSCPGDNVWPYLSGMRTDIADMLEIELEFVFNAYPNPFALLQTMSFELNKTSVVTIDIYDILGRRVNTIANGEYGKGINYLSWDGKNTNGKRAANGVYLIHSVIGSKVESKKVILLKE